MAYWFLQFIRSKREADWVLNLPVVSKMILFFFAVDRQNYYAGMNRFSETAPYVYQEFCDGNHPVKRSKNKFNQVWTDQALA